MPFPGGQELLIAALPSFSAGSAVNLLLLPSDSKPTLIREPRSALRAIHLSPDAPAVDVLLNDKRVVRKLMFRQDSAFVHTLSGTRTVKVTPADNTATAVITADVNLPANQAVSVLALNKLASIEPAVIVDDGKAPTAGNSKLRVLHASAGVPAVDVYLTAPTATLPSTPTIGSLTYKASVPASGAAALQVPAGEYRVRLTLAGKTDVVYDSGAFKIKAREDLVVAAIPPKADAAMQPSPVDLLVVRTRGPNSLLKSQTSTMPPVTPTMVTTSLRALHASPQAPAVDLLIDDTSTVSALSFGNFSERAAVMEGMRSVKINVAGTSTTVLSATITIAKDTAYTAVAYDTPASLKALVLKDEVKPVFAGARGYIRIVNLISDVQGTATFTGSSTGAGAFGTAAPYGENSPGSKSVTVSYATATGQGQGQAAVGFNLEQGNYYTVYAIGSATSAGSNPVRLIVSRDSKAP
ncbi:MAG: DUF4397 domain-containing protein [Burkholderiales bacterium]|nr:MAG: DUF4397 domain-containing protein [Burkholderiales bacterium]